MSASLNHSRKKQAGPWWSSQAGFTLIEVSVVLVIVTVGSILAVPAFTDWLAKSQLRSAMNEIAGALTFSRAAAMNRNTTVTVTLSMVGSKVQVSPGGLMPPTTMGIHVTGFTGGPVSFNSLGLRQGGGNADQLITVTNSRGRIYSAVVTPGGKIDWCPKSNCP